MRKGTPRAHRTPLAERFWPKVDKSGDCWLWTGATDGRGYGQVHRGAGKTGGHEKAHRVALKLSGVDIRGLHVLHRCDTPSCVNPAHLFVGTHMDNMRDMWRKGRGRCDGGGRVGASNGNARLSEQQVLEIYRRRSAGESQRGLAREFGVSKTLVGFIERRRVWPHVLGSIAT